MKYEAPPIIGPLDFEGHENNIILLEYVEDLSKFEKALEGKVNIIFSPEELNPSNKYWYNSAYVKCFSIYKAR